MIFLAALAAVQAPVSTGVRPLAEAVQIAGTFCEGEGLRKTSTVSLPDRTELYAGNQPGVGSIKPFTALPPLVQHFAATRPGRLSGLAGVVHFLSDAGGIWAVLFDNGVCDVMVTGVEDGPAVAETMARTLTADGWQTLREIQPSATTPLGQRLLLKRTPQSGAPDYGTRVLLKWLMPSQAEGVQVEAGYLSGDIPQSVTSKPQG